MAKGGARSGTHAPRPPRGAGVAAPQGGGGLACGGLWSAVRAQGDAAPRAHVTKNGVDVDLRSLGRQVADALAESGTLVGFGDVSPDPSETVVPQVQLRGVNAQGNDGSLDNLQVFTGFRSFLEFTQSETSLAASGRRMVMGYNTSANQPLRQLPSGGLVFLRRFLSGFSASDRSEEHTSELQSRLHLVCRLLLEKKKKNSKCIRGRSYCYYR